MSISKEYKFVLPGIMPAADGTFVPFMDRKNFKNKEDAIIFALDCLKHKAANNLTLALLTSMD